MQRLQGVSHRLSPLFSYFLTNLKRDSGHAGRVRRGFKGPFAHEYIGEGQYDARLTHALQLFQFSFKAIMLDICQGLVRLA